MHGQRGRPRQQPPRPYQPLTLHEQEFILLSMKALLVEVDDDLANRLERVAPARSRRRSEFIRRAILMALWAAEEQATAEAYRRQPDGQAAPPDPAVWDEWSAEDPA